MLEKHRLDHIDSLIMDAIVDFPGITNNEIGVLVGLGGKQVSNRRNAPKFKEAWNKLFLPPLERFQEKAAELGKRYLQLASQNEDLGVAEKATSKILASLGALKKEATDVAKFNILGASIENHDGTKSTEITLSVQPADGTED